MLVASLLAAAAALPSIAIEQTPKGYVAKVATFDIRQQADVDSEIARRAADLCRDKEVRWGEFRSVAKLGKQPAAEAAPVTGYSHEFSCVAPDLRTYDPAPADWQPSPSDDADVRHFFEDYYAKRDSGDFAAALAMFQPGEGFAKSLGDQREFNAKLGTGQRRITHVTWEVNPDAAAHPGVFAALDFVGEYKSMHFYCGYLGLYRIGPGLYEIVREEQTMFERNDHAPDPSQLANMRAAACRD